MNLNDFSQTVRERILSNAESLGEIKQVLDRDEDPDILADNAKLLPTCCVIPVGAGKMTMNFFMGDTTKTTEFQQNIVIYYQFSKDNKNPNSDVDVIRGYATTLISLFSSSDRTSANARCFNNCCVYKATAEFIPRAQWDYMLDRILITLHVKGLES